MSVFARNAVNGRARVAHALLGPHQNGGLAMLQWAIVFFVIALIAALMGFGGVAGMSADIGWLLAVLAVVVLAVGLLSRGFARGP